MRRSLAVASVLLPLVVSCGGPADDDADGGTSDTFIAFAADFTGYHAWQAFDVTATAFTVGIHDGSTVLEYLNHPPPHGSAEFPVGTIIVKEATGGTTTHQIFAMVKRGAPFNAGAPGWEWFELQNRTDGSDGVTIVWRGVGPPAGETYGGDPNGGCNTCHEDCGNDAVCAQALKLQNF